MPSAPIDTHQQLTAGDDCKAADGRALTWTSVNWPALAGATKLVMVVGHNEYNLQGNLPVTWTATPGVFTSTAASGSQTVSLDVTAAQTSALYNGEYDYMLTATLANGDTVTLANGKLTVFASPSNVPLYPPAV